MTPKQRAAAQQLAATGRHKAKRAAKPRKMFQINIIVPRDVEDKMRVEAKERAASLAQVARDILVRHYQAA